MKRSEFREWSLGMATVQPEISSISGDLAYSAEHFFRQQWTTQVGGDIQNGRWLGGVRWWFGLWGGKAWMFWQLPAGMHYVAIPRWKPHRVCMARLHPSLCWNGLASCQRGPFSDSRLCNACCFPADDENGRILDCDSSCNDPLGNCFAGLFFPDFGTCSFSRSRGVHLLPANRSHWRHCLWHLWLVWDVGTTSYVNRALSLHPVQSRGLHLGRHRLWCLRLERGRNVSCHLVCSKVFTCFYFCNLLLVI